jgi:hypothetical protein
MPEVYCNKLRSSYLCDGTSTTDELEAEQSERIVFIEQLWARMIYNRLLGADCAR